MRKCAEEIVRIERGSVMFYSEFPAIFEEMPDGVKEGILEGASGGAANSAPTASARVSDAIGSLYPNKWDTGDIYNLEPSKAKEITDVAFDLFKAD